MASSSATTNNSQTAFACRTCDNVPPVVVTLPHPVWTNGNSQEIIQLDMVVIGGENGLNS